VRDGDELGVEVLGLELCAGADDEGSTVGCSSRLTKASAVPKDETVGDELSMRTFIAAAVPDNASTPSTLSAVTAPICLFTSSSSPIVTRSTHSIAP
jgi:hypothetical protein